MRDNEDQDETSSIVVWEREIDHEALSGRWQKLGRWYGAPMAAVLVLALILGGFGAFLGVLILTGTFGLLLVALVFFKNLNSKLNAAVTIEDGHLVLGSQRVDLARVEAWSTMEDTEDWGVRQAATTGNYMAGNAITARVTFRLAQFDEAGQRGVRADGGDAFELTSFQWAEMPPDQLARLGDKLAPHIDAPRLPHGGLSY